MMKDHCAHDHITATKRSIVSKSEQFRWTFTPEQQRLAVAYWRSSWEPSERHAYHECHECDELICVYHKLIAAA